MATTLADAVYKLRRHLAFNTGTLRAEWIQNISGDLYRVFSYAKLIATYDPNADVPYWVTDDNSTCTTNRHIKQVRETWGLR
jgi:hypothetical protein